MNDKLNYWEEEYSKNAIPLYPSQFAAFVASELFDSETHIIDVGCGNGRDSIFFAHLGKQVIGIDGSSVVVETNNKLFEKQSQSLHFISSKKTLMMRLLVIINCQTIAPSIAVSLFMPSIKMLKTTFFVWLVTV